MTFLFGRTNAHTFELFLVPNPLFPVDRTIVKESPPELPLNLVAEVISDPRDLRGYASPPAEFTTCQTNRLTFPISNPKVRNWIIIRACQNQPKCSPDTR